MRRHILTIVGALLSATTPLWADIDVTNLFLENAGFDNADYFNYTKNDYGNVSQEILPIYGWTTDIGVDYTVTGVYELGTKKTFNTNGKVPATGYNGSTGGCLALSTGWDQPLKYFQDVQLPAGTYKLQAAFYNGSNSANGGSLLGWIPTGGQAAMSSTGSFPLNSWTADEVTFSLQSETDGHIQIGFLGASGGSANSAKVVVDYVKLVLTGDNDKLNNNQRSVLQQTANQANKLYAEGNGNESEALKKAINTAQNAIDNPTATFAELYTLNNSLKQQITLYNWANTPASNPANMTGYITNPSFEDGLKGWSASGLKSQTNTSFSQKKGNTYVEQWVSNGNQVGTFSLLQTLSPELPKGIYRLSVAAQNTQNGKTGQTGVWIVAGGDSIAVSEAKTYTLQFVHMEDQLTIGIVGYDASGNWVALDNFTLTYWSATTSDYANELTDRIATANQLLEGRINKDDRNSLQTAVKAAEDWLEGTDPAVLPIIAGTLRKSIQKAALSASKYDQLATEIEKTEKLKGNFPKGNEQLEAALYNAKADLDDDNLAPADIDKSVSALQAAVLALKIANATGPAPTVGTDARVLRGATMAFGRASFGGNNLMEKGFCWATHYNPTVTDQRSTLSYSNNGDIYVIEGLQPSTFYYVRPYAISNNYAVGYGNCVKICTLPMGGITWKYNNGGSDEENDRINAAVADAVDIWNNLTSIKGVQLSVSYGANTPTADCSYGGSMRVGPNSSYQRTGTIQHEMAHAVGVGTTDHWYNSSTYRQSTSTGIWLGERTDQVLCFLENNENAHLKGDDTHFWPYGVNGAHEDDGTRILYYANALIVQALGEDFLPPVYGAFATPAYTYTQEDDNTYYLVPEGGSLGSQTPMLADDGNGNVVVKNNGLASALNDPSFTWKMHFNPQTQLYELVNNATGKSLANNGSQATLSSSENFGIQLLGSREKTTFGKFNLKSYWLVFNNGTNQPLTLANSNGGNTTATRFDHQNSATKQRWIILTRHELMDLAGIDYTGEQVLEGHQPELNVWGGPNNITIETGDKGCWVAIYDITGHQLDMFYMQAGMKLTKTLPAGVYIVNGEKAIVTR